VGRTKATGAAARGDNREDTESVIRAGIAIREALGLPERSTTQSPQAANKLPPRLNGNARVVLRKPLRGVRLRKREELKRKKHLPGKFGEVSVCGPTVCVCGGGGGGGDMEWVGRREMHSIPTPSLPRAACLQTTYKALHQLLRLLKFQATSAIPSILNHPDLRLDVGRADLHVSRMVPEAAMVSIQHVQAGLVSLMSAARSGDETAGSQLEGVQQRLKKVRGAGR
jgi:hypothetical protein